MRSTLSPRLEEHLRARLHLYGVLGAIPKMLRLAPEARALVEKEVFSVELSTRSGLSAVVRFNHGDAVFETESPTPADISLYFITDKQANKLFTQRGISVPVPVRGWSQMHKLKVFKDVTDKLQHYLKPSAQDLNNPQVLSAHVRLLLGLVVRSLKQIAEHDPEARHLLTHCPEGLAAFSVGNDVEAGWISYRHNAIECGFGEPPSYPEVCVRFKNPDLALKALNDEIDVNAEVSSGTIEVNGLAPLADCLGALMQRIPHYLDV